MKCRFVGRNLGQKEGRALKPSLWHLLSPELPHTVMLTLKEKHLHKAVQDRFLPHLSNIIPGESLYKVRISHCFPMQAQLQQQKAPRSHPETGFPRDSAAVMALPAEITNYGSVGLQC